MRAAAAAARLPLSSSASSSEEAEVGAEDEGALPRTLPFSSARPLLRPPCVSVSSSTSSSSSSSSSLLESELLLLVVLPMSSAVPGGEAGRRSTPWKMGQQAANQQARGDNLQHRNHAQLATGHFDPSPPTHLIRSIRGSGWSAAWHLGSSDRGPPARCVPLPR